MPLPLVRCIKAFIGNGGADEMGGRKRADSKTKAKQEQRKDVFQAHRIPVKQQIFGDIFFVSMHSLVARTVNGTCTIQRLTEVKG